MKRASAALADAEAADFTVDPLEQQYQKCYHVEMKVITAQVVDGRIDAPPEIEDGSYVAILAPEAEGPVVLSTAQERELSEALADIQAGRSVDGWDLLNELKAQNRA